MALGPHDGEVARRIQAVGCELAADRLGTDHVAEAAFFVGEGNRFERETQRNLLLLHAAQALQASQHAQRTIQVAGARYRVQMRAGHDAGPLAVPVQPGMDVGGAVHERGDLRAETGRGCPWTCHYCYNVAFHGATWRPLKPDAIAAGIAATPGNP